MIALVTGGAASGKSEYAEELARRLKGSPKIYLATMEAWDEESLARIARHRKMRQGKGFQTLELPQSLEKAEIPAGSVVLLECLTTWLANEMYPPDTDPRDGVPPILAGISHLSRQADHLIVVSGEVFSQPVPAGMEAYVRTLGQIHQQIAAQGDLVVEVVCGIPVYHKKPKGWEW